MNNFRGDLGSISAKTATLITTAPVSDSVLPRVCLFEGHLFNRLTSKCTQVSSQARCNKSMASRRDRTSRILLFNISSSFLRFRARCPPAMAPNSVSVWNPRRTTIIGNMFILPEPSVLAGETDGGDTPMWRCGPVFDPFAEQQCFLCFFAIRTSAAMSAAIEHCLGKLAWMQSLQACRCRDDNDTTQWKDTLVADQCWATHKECTVPFLHFFLARCTPSCYEITITQANAG